VTRLTIEQLRVKVNALDAIPTIPAVVQPLSAVLRLPPEQVELEKVIKLASYDSTISAQCVRMANSPLFGRRRTDTLRSAVLALGLKRVEGILLGCCLNRIVPADKWAFDPLIFWRHSLGCALVSQKIAKLIGFPEPDKAHLAGLLHDLGVLVNTLVCSDAYRECLLLASQERLPLEQAEQKSLGFTHCQSGRILAEQWGFPSDVTEVIAYHHNIDLSHTAGPLVSLVHLSDLLCRLRDLGYGYYEAVSMDLTSDPAWAVLLEHCPMLASTDIARLTMDIDGAMEEITNVVDAVFKP
jgi:putative nucleotidyltransferase with HDIG domain